MARASSSSTKFASVNLNKSYGKPAAAQGAQLQGSGGSRARIASHGGMLLLTRPVRSSSSSQPAAAAAALQKGAKLTVPLPVNLPSLRREHAGNDPNVALVGGATGASGWPKQQQQQQQQQQQLHHQQQQQQRGEAEEVVSSDVPVQLSSAAQGESNAGGSSRSTPALSAGSTWGASQFPTVGQPLSNPGANGELRPSAAPHLVARSGVYTPPRARTAPVKVNAAPPPAPIRPVAVEKAVVLRGEDFPTLQAALPPAPPPPQHRQKELQQKQREKQQELKDQHQKLQLLSHKPAGEEPLQPQQVVVAPPLQPAQPVSSPAQARPPQSLPNDNTTLSLEPQTVSSLQQAGSRPGFKTEGFSSYGGGPPPVRLNQRSNWTDDEREPAQSLRPLGGGHGGYSEWPDRPEREHFQEDPRRNNRGGEDYGFGRQFSQRENPPSFGTGSRDMELGSREGSGFGADGGHSREGNVNSSYNSSNNLNREERHGREGMGRRDGVPGREGGGGGGAYGKDGGYNSRESALGRDGGFGREGGGGYGRQGTFGREGGGAGREFVPGKENNLDRDGYGRPGSGGRDYFRDGFGKDGGPRENFYKDSSFGRDGNINRDGPYRDNRRPSSGDYDGGRGRFGGDRFVRGEAGRFNGGSDFNRNKGGPFASGRGGGIMGLDSGLDFNREKRFGVPYTEDAFARDFPDLPGPFGLGESSSAVESKLIRRKKEEAQVTAVYDSEREAFEAELERVQKIQEEERLRRLEEKERAIEQARKEQEEQERLAKEEVERQLRLEDEAREAAARAEQEALEAARKVEEEKRAREEEKKNLLLEDERRKENARRKLQELEERIARREAEKKKQDEEALMPEEDRLLSQSQRQSQDYEASGRRDVSSREEDERILASLTGADQDDDERAPLRPSRRPASPPVPRSPEDFPSRLKSPDVQSMAGRRMPDLRGGNAFEADRSRSFSSWRRDVMDNGTGSPQTSLYGGREEISEFQFGMARDRMYPGRREYGEREAFYGATNSALTSDVGPGENAARKDRIVGGFQERRWPGDETGPSNKRSASPRATTPDSDGGFLDNSYDREGDRHWGRDKIDRQRSFRDGKRTSPPPPSSYFQGADEVSSYGRLRQSLAKQPRAPPPPLRGAPLHRPPLKSSRDLANSSPSPLLHPSGDDFRGSPWQQDGAPESQSIHLGRSLSGGVSAESAGAAAASKQLELMPRDTTVSAPEKSQGRETPGPISSLRPQRSYLQSARGITNESSNENSELQVADFEKASSSPRDDSSFSPATPGSHTEQNEEDSEEAVSPRAAVEGKSEDEEADYAEDDEDDVEADDDEEYVDEVDLDDERDLDEEVDDEADFDPEVGLEFEVDLEPDLDGEEWEDDVDLDSGMEKRIEDPGAAAQFSGEYHPGNVEYKEEGESDRDYSEYEQSGEHEHEDVSGVKHDYSEAEVKETSTPESPDSRQQQEKDYQNVPQPFLQHIITQAASGPPLTSVLPVQVAQGETYVSQVQQPLSFIALSLPQPHATPTMSQVSSLVASLPVLQNPQEGSVPLQFGLLPSTSLLPGSSVPAIQIGSIQMPLHLHPQSGPPLFQFGQLGHQTPLPPAHPLSASQSQGQAQNANPGASQLNGTLQQEAHVADLPGKELFTSQGDQISSQQPAKPIRATQPGHSAVGDVNSTDAEAPELKNGRTGFRPERRSRDRSSRDAVIAPHIRALQRVGSGGAFESSSSENSIATPGDNSFENNNQGGDISWNRSYVSGRGGRGNVARWTGPPSRGRGRGGSYGGRGASDVSSVSTANYPAETGMEGGPRMRPSRRSNYRRTEFKVRDSTLPPDRSFQDSLAGTKQATGTEKYSQSGWNEGSGAASGDASDGSMSRDRDGHQDSVSHHQDNRKYYGDSGQSSHSFGGGRSAQGSVSKVDRSGRSGSPLKNGGRASGYGTARPEEGLLGRYSPEVTSDVSLIEQPGTEAPSDEDDFIEVRSKRQMLNDRREQKEKEMKAKSKDMKAKEQAARKQQRAATKGGFQGESGVGSKSSGLAGPEKKSAMQQSAALEASNSSNSRLAQTVISPAVVSSTSLPASNNPAQLPPIGTPAGGSGEMAYDKRSKNSKPRASSAPGGNLVEVDVPASSPYENQDGISGNPTAWGGTRSTLQVVSLTQIQLEEAMKPVRFEAPVPPQLPFGDRSTLGLEPAASVSSATGKDKPSASPSGPVGSLLAGEKIQFGAVTSPPIPLPSSRPITPGLNAVVGSGLGPRADEASDESELKSKSKRLSGAGNEVSPFTGKSKRTRGDDERGGDGIDAEAEAAASAVAVAAISSDESVGSTHHGDGHNMPLRGVKLSGSGNKNSYGKPTVTSSRSISMGDGNTSSVMIQGSGLEESISVALPADLSVEPQTISHQGPTSNTSGLLHQALPGGALPYRGLEMGTMLGGPMFGFGTSKDTSQNPQGVTSGSVHDQGIGNSAGSGGGSGGGWQQPQHSGGVDSYYAGPPSSYAGPFINPAGGIPSIQGPPHMLVYTNPFASVSQFGQLGVSFMGPQQYLASGKQPDWKHTPVSSAGVGGMSGGEGGLGGIMSGQRSSGVTNNVQRMAPGPSVISAPGPFDLNLSAPFQIPGVEVSMQSQWSHVPGPPLHTVPISGPQLMGFAMQSRHSRGGPTHIGHLPQHMMETTSGFNLVPASNNNPVTSGLFQQSSVDPAAQFPDELGLGDTSSSVTNNSSSSSSFQRGQRPSSNRVPPVSSSVVSPSGGGAAAAVGVNSSKLRSGRRSSRVARGGSSLGGGGGNGAGISISNINVGMGPSSGVSQGQAPNGSRAPSPHLQSSQMPPISLGQQQHSHPSSNPYAADQRGSPQQQQGLPRVGGGISSSQGGGGWSGGQGGGRNKGGGGPGRPPVSERGSNSGDKNNNFVSSSSKLKQVYVVKPPSSSPRRNNIGDASSNLFSGSEVGQTAVGH